MTPDTAQNPARPSCAVTIGHARPMAVREPQALIVSVDPGSIADQLGLRPGDRINRVNGQPPRDIIDWDLWTAAEELDLLVTHEDGREDLYTFGKDVHEDLGLGFETELFTPLRTCNNDCPFCFVLQAPPGLRPTVYVKDDDYRLSFLHGHFVTLTNMTEQHIERVLHQQLSPLHVSVHASSPAARRELLGNQKADVGWRTMTTLLDAGLECHTQIVCCPGVNDGVVLNETVEALRALGPGVLSVGVVPVGLTRFQSNPTMRPMTPAEAGATIDAIDAFRSAASATPVYAADELYLEAGRPIPPDAYYDDYCQLDNGIGLVRLLLDEVDDLAMDLPTEPVEGRLTMVTGEYGALFLPPLVELLNRVPGFSAELAVVRNDLFGGNVACAGLLAGADIIAQVGPRPGRVVALPRRAVDKQERLIDSVTLDELSAALEAEVIVADSPLELAVALGLLPPAEDDAVIWLSS